MRGVTKKSNSTWKRLLVFIFLSLLLVILTNSTRKVYIKNREAKIAMQKMEQEIEELKNREVELKEFQARLKTDEGIEYEIRKKFSVARADEKVAIIVKEDDTASTTPKVSNIWDSIKNFFTDLFE